MRTFATPPLLLTRVLAGCSLEAPTADSLYAPALARVAASPTSRPLSGRCETSFDPLPFPPPPVLRQVDTGTCQLAHLGRTTMHSVQDIDLATGTQTSVSLTFTAANGDVLRARNVGTSVPSGPGVRFQGTTTFFGGTGRFANATGEAHIVGTANFRATTAEFTIVDGWIAYGASVRDQQP
jgi:hypothetical protein